MKADFHISDIGRCVIHLPPYPNQRKTVKPFIISLVLFFLLSFLHGPSTETPGRRAEGLPGVQQSAAAQPAERNRALCSSLQQESLLGLEDTASTKTNTGKRQMAFN